MGANEQTLGIVLQARAEVAAAVRDAKSGFAEIGNAAKTAAATANDAFQRRMDEMGAASNRASAVAQSGFKKTAEVGRVAFQGVASSLTMVGGQVGALAGSFGSMFQALSMGNPWLAVATIGVTGLGVAYNYLKSEMGDAIATTEDFERALQNVGRTTSWAQIQVSGFSGDLSDFANRLANGGSSLNNFDSALSRLASAPTMADLAQQQDLFRSFLDSSDVAIRAFAIQELKSINDQIQRLRDIAAGPGAIKPSAVSSPVKIIEADTPELLAQNQAYLDKKAGQQSAYDKTIEGLRLNQAQAETAANKQITADQQTELEARQQAFITHTQFLASAYQSMVMSFANADMTGKQRREQIWESFKQSTLSRLGQLTSGYIVQQLAIRNAAVTTAGVQASASHSAALAEIADAVAVGAKWLAAMAAKVASFYASFGLFGIPLAAGTIAGFVALAKAVHFAEGGIVPGNGYRDSVPALLTPRERVISAPQYAANSHAIERAIAGESGGGGNTYHFTLSGSQGSTVGDMLALRQQLETWFVPMFERAVDERRFRRGYQPQVA